MSELRVNWKSFYQMGGVSAWLLLVYSLVTIVVMLLVGGIPETAQEGFDILAANRLVGMLRLDVLTIFCMPFYYLLILGLAGRLKDTDAGKTILALVSGLIGVSLTLAIPAAFSFLALSDKFAAATSEAQRALLLAAGEGVLVCDMWHSSGALVGGLLMQISMVLFSLLMLRSQSFGKATGWIGVFMHGADLLHIVVGFFSASLGSTLLFVIGPLYLVWFPLLGRDFFRMARDNS